MAQHTEVAPQLPPASVDFNALHDACRAGKSAEDALDAAVVAETVYTREAVVGEVVEVPAPDQGAEAADETIGEDGKPKTKAQLRTLLDGRGVAYESDANWDRLAELVRDNPAPPPSPAPASETEPTA